MKRRIVIGLLVQEKNCVKKLNNDIESGKIFDWKKFSKLKNFHEPPSPLGLNDLVAFENFFKQLYKKDNQQPSPPVLNMQIPSPNIFDNLNSNIEHNEVTETVKNLKLGKSCSLDLVSNEFIKCLPIEGLKALTSLFNFCLSQGCYPWNSSIIVPLHKTGDKHNPDNYRAIGISSCLGKTFSTILLNRLLKFRSENCPD